MCSAAEIRFVTKKTASFSVIILLIITLVLFDVDINPEFSLARETEVLDDAQETLFDDCVSEKDRQIHAETFSKIDNPDVQREVLLTGKESAVRACRISHPEIRVTASEPFRFNIFDLTFRYR